MIKVHIYNDITSFFKREINSTEKDDQDTIEEFSDIIKVLNTCSVAHSVTFNEEGTTFIIKAQTITLDSVCMNALFAAGLYLLDLEIEYLYRCVGCDFNVILTKKE